MKKKNVMMFGIPYFTLNLILFLLYILNLIPSSILISYVMSDLYTSQGLTVLYMFFVILYFPYTFINPFGFLFIIISGLYLYRLRIRRSIIFGIFGTIIYILTIIILTLTYLENFEPLLLFLMFFWLLTSIINVVVFGALRSEREKLSLEDELKIKKVVLDLGTKYTRLEVREISEKCDVDSDSIIEVLEKMIANKEIFAAFFKSSNTVSFDQQANIDEIDELMAVYKDWENTYYRKQEFQDN